MRLLRELLVIRQGLRANAEPKPELPVVEREA
jgi:hypothetical protein